MNCTETKEILIIGAGPVGLYGWNCAGLLGLSGYIIEHNSQLGGQPAELYPDKLIYDIPGFSAITGKDLTDKLIHHSGQNGSSIELIEANNVISFNKEKDYFNVKLSNQTELKVKTILITTGNGSFNPRPLGINPEPTNLVYNANLLKLEDNQHLIILGGGDSAIDWANYYAKVNQNLKITLIHRRDEYRAKNTSVEELYKHQMITKLNSYRVDSFIYKSDGSAKQINLENLKNHDMIKIDCDWILVQYGALINNSLLNLWPIEINEQKKIVINSRCETSIKGVFAAGNAVFYDGKYNNMVSGFGEVATALYNITRYLHGEKYNPGYFGDKK